MNHTIGEVDGEQENGKSYNDDVEPYITLSRRFANEFGAITMDIPLRMSIGGMETKDFVSGDQIHLSLQTNHDYADIVFRNLNEIKLG